MDYYKIPDSVIRDAGFLRLVDMGSLRPLPVLVDRVRTVALCVITNVDGLRALHPMLLLINNEMLIEDLRIEPPRLIRRDMIRALPRNAYHQCSIDKALRDPGRFFAGWNG